MNRDDRSVPRGHRALLAIDQLDAPPTWAAIPPDDGDGAWPDAVAGQLGAVERDRATVADALRRVHALLRAPEHQAVCVWVPDPAVAQVAGHLTVDWLIPDDGEVATREFYRPLIEHPAPGRMILDRQVDDVEVPAGPALRVREMVGVRASRLSWRRQAQYHVIYTIFPHACDDAVALAFATDAPGLVDAIDADAAFVVDSLRVAVGAA